MYAVFGKEDYQNNENQYENVGGEFPGFWWKTFIIFMLNKNILNYYFFCLQLLEAFVEFCLPRIKRRSEQVKEGLTMLPNISKDLKILKLSA